MLRKACNKIWKFIKRNWDPIFVGLCSGITTACYFGAGCTFGHFMAGAAVGIYAFKELKKYFPGLKVEHAELVM